MLSCVGTESTPNTGLGLEPCPEKHIQSLAGGWLLEEKKKGVGRKTTHC